MLYGSVSKVETQNFASLDFNFCILYCSVSKVETQNLASPVLNICILNCGASKVETQNFASHKKGCAKTEVKGSTSLLRLLPWRRKILRLYWAYAIIVLNKTGCARIFKSKLSSRLVVLFLRKIIRNIHNTPMNQTGVKHGIDSNHNCKCCIIISIRSDNSRKVLYNICTFLTHVMNTLL